ncbi:palmitoyltransferase [Plasmodium gonderi]|uniref:Palmitoyltransferase n=1 Tax=Plasmodium gonderi TaxID=77519 RepID=A0A1Y1JL29_PLAGO|nr:palmitoyltransferase [Plasmodium gonderi]GAW82338.1 palmitoyltransferase [Plasmodium gonderi]
MDELLFHLVRRRDERIYEFLEREKNLINCRDKNGNTLLHWAVFLNDSYLTCYLLENGADVNAESGNKQTPLFWAVSGNNIFMIHVLRRYGCNIFQVDDKGYNCLTISIQYNYTLSFLYLIHLKLPLMHRDFNDCTVLDWAAYNNNIFFLRLFSKFSQKLYTMHLKKPASILHKAIIGNAYDAVVFLVLHGHQNVYDISTDEKKSVLQFVEENKDKVDARIYHFITSKKTQDLCKSRSKKRNQDLYEPNGMIGAYPIERRKKLHTMRKIHYTYSNNRALLLYPGMIILSHLYLTCVYFFYTRGTFQKESLILDMVYPLIFILYYMVISSDPGYLEDSKNCLNSQVGGDNQIGKVGDADMTHQLVNKQKAPSHEIGNTMESEWPNATFLKVIQNIEEEITRYEEKNKVRPFCENIKCKNIMELKKSLNIRLDDACGFEISSFDIKKLCPSCFLLKNLRSKHCRFCDKCIDLYDHHCVFTLNCMSVDNAKIFLLWILTNLLFHSTEIYIHISKIIRSFGFFYTTNLFRLFSLSIIVISILHIWFMGSIFLRSVLNIIENITSNEKFKMYSANIFISYELKIDKNNEPIVIRKFKNPFDQGAFINLIHFFTKSKKNLIKMKPQFIHMDQSIDSAPVRNFVEKLNDELSRFYASR